MDLTRNDDIVYTCIAWVEDQCLKGYKWFFIHRHMASDEPELEDPVDGLDLGFPGTDLTLVVEGQKIHVNKAVLSEHSPVFNIMFKSQFKESTAKEIVLEEKKAADVVEFLKCFYPNMKHPITGRQYSYISKQNYFSLMY